jgi:hypothetical protein
MRSRLAVVFGPENALLLHLKKGRRPEAVIRKGRESSSACTETEAPVTSRGSFLVVSRVLEDQLEASLQEAKPNLSLALWPNVARAGLSRLLRR